MRYKAFTLLELVVAMALSAILISMAYLALQLVQRQQGAIAKSTELVAQINTLQWLLDRDFRSSEQVVVRGHWLRCQQRERTIEYELLDSCIVRYQQQQQDSFAVHVLGSRFYSKSLPLGPDDGVIDEVTLSLTAASDTFELQAATHYDSQQLLRNTFTSPPL